VSKKPGPQKTPPGGRGGTERPPTRGNGSGGRGALEGSREAKRIAVVVLEVLAGTCTTAEGAAALGITTARYYQLEARALQGLIAALEPRTRGPGQRPESRISALERERDRLARELARSQSLVRLAHRAIGIASPAPAKPAAGGKARGGGKKKRRRRTTARVRRVVGALREPPASPSEEPAQGAGDGRDVA